MIFVADECVSWTAVECLKLLSKGQEWQIFHLKHDGLAPQGTEDAVWTVGLPLEFEYILTRDANMRVKPRERETWRSAPRVTFFLGAAWTKRRKVLEQTAMLLHWWPTILETARKAEHGQGYIVKWQDTIKPLERRY